MARFSTLLEPFLLCIQITLETTLATFMVIMAVETCSLYLPGPFRLLLHMYMRCHLQLLFW